MKSFSQPKFPIWLLLLLVAVNGLIIAAPLPTMLRFTVVVGLLFFLHGWIWLQIFLIRPLEFTQRFTLSIGLSIALTTWATLFAVYLPGPLTMMHILVVINSLIVVGLIITWRQNRTRAKIPFQWPIIISLVVPVLLAIVLRLPHLGYAEFHEDEAEALMLGVRLFQGEDYAIFLHRKGPAQMLVPVSLWLLTDQITEVIARFPFALSSILSVVTLFFMGRRWFGWQAGVAAGILWAIHGYAIGFGRMVQYQALVFFLGPLAIYCLYLAWKDKQLWLQIPAAVLLATCLLAHFDALLLLPVAGYLIWLILKTKKQRVITLFALLLFVVLLAAFYVPYFLDPEFGNTVAYLTESRVKPGLLYNNLDLLRRLDQEYSSHFYLPLLLLGIISFIIKQSKNFTQKWRGITLGLSFLAVSTWLWPDIWRFDKLDLAVLPWLLLGGVLVWFSDRIETRITWILLGVPFIGYVFLVDDPRTHLYIIYPGATLLAGAGWAGVIQWADSWQPDRGKPRLFYRHILTTFVLIVITVLVSLIVLYSGIIFLQKESKLMQLRQRWNDSGWEFVYNNLPQERSYFGYPKREGWKAIGALRTQSYFSGDFRSVNEDFIIPIWYNYGQARSCYDTPAHFFVRLAGSDAPLTDQPYVETGRVQREDEVRLRIFSADINEQAEPVPVYSLENLEGWFDRLATPHHFAQQNEPPQLVGAVFDTTIEFVGYNLSTATVTPGGNLQLDLYWQALETPKANYRAFVHLTDGTTLWAQQDDDPACRLPTSIWRTDQRGMGQFRLQLNPETPPGHYPLVIGLYHADTLERLKITVGAGQPGDDFLWLQDIEVVEAN